MEISADIICEYLKYTHALSVELLAKTNPIVTKNISIQKYLTVVVFLLTPSRRVASAMTLCKVVLSWKISSLEF